MNSASKSYHLFRLLTIAILTIGFCLLWQLPPVSAYSGIEGESDSRQPYLVKEFTVQGAGVLKAFTVAGNIEVQRISDTDRVRVELYIERGYAIWSDSRNLDNYRINILQRGNEIIASVEQKTKNTGFFSDRMSFSYKVYLPRAMSTELKTLGGHIRLSGVRGDHMVRSNGGNIELADLAGRIGAYTSGGSIDIARSKGTIYAQSHGGNIHLKNSGGELRLKTSGGNIISTQTSGSFIARVDGGNIQAQFMEVGEGISMETTAGNIYAALPRGLGFDLFAAAPEVELDDLDDFEGERSTRKVDGRLNEGGTPVRLQTPAGKITIKIE